jgi:Helix-turn-helix domain, rpiR family
MDAGVGVADRVQGGALLGLILGELPQLSPTMRTIGRYCVRVHARLHLMGIDEVASECGTVPSSVVRFARRFGHSGFHDFKRAFLDATTLPLPGEDHLLGHLDEDVFQLSELRVLIQDSAFRQALRWLDDSSALSLTYRGEFDRLVAIHLGNALQRVGKCVVLSDRPQQAGILIDIDLERTDLPAEGVVEQGRLSISRQVSLHGTRRHRLLSAQPEAGRLVLVIAGSTLGRRLQKALSIADTIEAALH